MIYKIKEMHEFRKMTQLELCRKANISRQTLSDLEGGKEVNTTISTLQKLACALKCKVSDIFCFEV